MNLFFESSGQAVCFLCMTPVGMFIAFCLDTDVIAGKLRVFADLFLLLAAGVAVLFMLVLCKENDLRLYHFLGFATGAVLYVGGFGKIIRTLKRRQDSKNGWRNKYHQKG